CTIGCTHLESYVGLALAYNDNTGNPYSDVFWLAALVQSIGEFEFGQQVHGLLLWLILKITCMNHFSDLSISCLLSLRFPDHSSLSI
ncbi:transcription initiation factor TFIID subunit 2-like, partial [Trifolium medium]|nr:transcription initiation factor TFIID subunit 2-like [Trifolium medium]